MANDSNITLISDDLVKMDSSKETLKDLVTAKQDNSSALGSASVASGEKEKEQPAVKGSREEMSKKQSVSSGENLPTPSKRDSSSVKSMEMIVPSVIIVPAPSLQTLASDESLKSLPKDSMEKVLGHTTSLLNEAELEASELMNEEEHCPDQLHSLMNCRICQLFVRTVDRLLDKSEEAMDRYLPLTEEEISNLKQAVAELDTSPEDHQKSACLDRITALSSRLRQRAYMMALGKLRLARRSTHSNLSQLQMTIDLIEHAQQEAEPDFQKSHEQLIEICSRWSQERQSCGALPPYKPEEVLAASSGQFEAGAPLTVDGSAAAGAPSDEKITEAAAAGAPSDGKITEAMVTGAPSVGKLAQAVAAGIARVGKITEAVAAGMPKDGTITEAAAAQVPRDGNTAEEGVSPLAAYRSPMETGVPFARDRLSDEAQFIFTVPGCEEENGFPSTEVESKTLEMSRNLTLDLQGTYKTLLTNLKDLPHSLKGKLYQTYGHLAELHTKFNTAHRFADLPGSVLEKALAIMSQAQEALDEVMEFAFQHPMGMWVEEQRPASVTEDHPPALATTETPSAQREEGDILKIQAAYDPKGCDEDDA